MIARLKSIGSLASVLLLVALVAGAFVWGQKVASDRERALLAQMRLLTEQYSKDRQQFLDTIRALKPGAPPIDINLPSLDGQGQVRVIERGPGTIRVEVTTKEQVPRAEVTKREKAGSTAIDLTVKPEDLRGLPPEKRKASAIEDPATGTFACVEGTLCEDATTRQTFPRRQQLSRFKFAAQYPLVFGVAYELVRLGPVAADALALAELGDIRAAITLPSPSASFSVTGFRIGLGAAYQISDRWGAGLSWTVNTKIEPRWGIYATYRF